MVRLLLALVEFSKIKKNLISISFKDTTTLVMCGDKKWNCQIYKQPLIHCCKKSDHFTACYMEFYEPFCGIKSINSSHSIVNQQFQHICLVLNALQCFLVLFNTVFISTVLINQQVACGHKIGNFIEISFYHSTISI